MLFEKHIRRIVREEFKEQIRKQTLRMRILDECARVRMEFMPEIATEYFDKAEEVKNRIDRRLDVIGKIYGVEVRAIIYTRMSDVLDYKYDEYHFQIREKDSDKWIDIDKW